MNSDYQNRNIFIFLFILYSFQLFYFFYYFFTYGIFIQYGYAISDLTSLLILSSVLFSHIMILVYLILIIYGYIQKSHWIPKFIMFFLFWSILWCLWGIIIGNNFIIHTILIIFYILAIFYLKTESFKKYFYKIFYYGKYVLYTRFVKLKSGLSLPIFFFSTHHPKSGSPSALPEGYMINENPRSHMPYLKKIKHKDAAKELKEDSEKKQDKNEVIYVNYIMGEGSKKGKWVVKNKDRILSSHRTKNAAIIKARAIAINQSYRVMVKKINGKFNYGFKPKK